MLRKGDGNGNGMLIRIGLPSGMKTLGIPTENAYGGGLDLGPNWNDLVLDDIPFLVDTGREGMGQKRLISHLERLCACGDAVALTEGTYTANGDTAFESAIRSSTLKA